MPAPGEKGRNVYTHTLVIAKRIDVFFPKALLHYVLCLSLHLVKFHFKRIPHCLMKIAWSNLESDLLLQDHSSPDHLGLCICCTGYRLSPQGAQHVSAFNPYTATTYREPHAK